MRTIAVLPALTKLYELCLYELLLPVISNNNLLSESQRGFTRSKSCMDNLIDVVSIIQSKLEVEAEQVRSKVPVKHRTKPVVLFFDLKKAFDKVDRGRLIRKMLKMNIPNELIGAISATLQNTCVTVQETKTLTY